MVHNLLDKLLKEQFRPSCLEIITDPSYQIQPYAYSLLGSKQFRMLYKSAFFRQNDEANIENNKNERFEVVIRDYATRIQSHQRVLQFSEQTGDQMPIDEDQLPK